MRIQCRLCTNFQMDKNLEVVDPSTICITYIFKEQGVDATSFGEHMLKLGSRYYVVI